MSGTEETISLAYVEGDLLPGSTGNKALPFRRSNSYGCESQSLGFEERSESGKAVERSPIFYYIYVAFFGSIGCLCRILMDQLFGKMAKVENSALIINASFISNMLACFILGALYASRLHQTKLKALYKGLAIGFCGSLSTWSNWNQQLSLLLINETKSESQNQVSAILGYLIGLLSFFGSYYLGMDLMKTIRRNKKIASCINRGRARIFAHVTTTLLLIVSFTMFVIMLLLEVPEKEKSIFFSLILAPFAACLRKKLITFRTSFRRFLVGVVILNVMASVLVALLHVIETRVAPYDCGKEKSICWPRIGIYAVEYGFCGTLSTISDLVFEFDYLKREGYSKLAYFFVAVTLFSTQFLIGVVNGVNFNLA